MNKSSLFFMDESFDYNEGEIDSCSLTGILVPSELCCEIQEKIYSFLVENLLEEESPQKLIFLEIGQEILHGSNFMKGYQFSKKMAMLNSIVALVNEYRIKIFRACYLVTDENRKHFNSDAIKKNFARTKNQKLCKPVANNLVQFCWVALQGMLQDMLNNNVIIPIIEDDKDNEAQKLVFSKSSRHTQTMLIDKSINAACSLTNNKNLFEVLYSKKKYSILNGVVDCISYFLLRKQKKITDSLVDIIGEISSELLREQIIDLQCD